MDIMQYIYYRMQGYHCIWQLRGVNMILLSY